MTQDRSTLGEDRASFLARVRQTLGRPPGEALQPPQPPQVDESLVRLAGPEDDVLAMFAQRAAGLGMQVHQAPLSAAASRVVGVLSQTGARRVGISIGRLDQTLALDQTLRQHGLEIVDWQSSPGLDTQFDLDAGVTDVQAALAETGALVCTSGPDRSRGLSLIPPVHVALVRRSDILPDMIDYWQQVGSSPADLPSSTVFIAGPSKTADIEGELVVGVHGPGQVHIILMPDA